MFILWLRWAFVAAQAFSSCGEWGLPFTAVLRLLSVAASLVAENRLYASGLQWLRCVDPLAGAPRLQSTWAHWLWRRNLVALQHVESSWIGGQTHLPCTGRWIPNCWTTREVFFSLILSLSPFLPYFLLSLQTCLSLSYLKKKYSPLLRKSLFTISTSSPFTHTSTKCNQFSLAAIF